MIGAFVSFHAALPKFGIGITRTVEQWLNEGDLTAHTDIALAFDGKACKAMTRDFRHDVAGSDLLNCHVSKFKRGEVTASDQRAHKSRSAVLGNFYFGAVAVATGYLNIAKSLHSISRSQNLRTLVQYLHLQILLQ